MADELTREQFERALADAAAGVLTVYREVDALLRELKAALASEKPAFAQFGATVVPGVRRNPDARYLRNYLAAYYRPVDDDAADDEDDEPDNEDDGDDDDDDDEKPGKKKSLTLATGSGLLIARVSVYDRSVASFAPTLLVGALTQARVEPEVPVGSLVKLGRSRLRTLTRVVYEHRSGATLKTGVPVQVEDVPKTKSKHRLVFTLPAPLARHRLYDVSPDAVPTIAGSLRAAWSASAGK